MIRHISILMIIFLFFVENAHAQMTKKDYLSTQRNDLQNLLNNLESLFSFEKTDEKNQEINKEVILYILEKDDHILQDLKSNLYTTIENYIFFEKYVKHYKLCSELDSSKSSYLSKEIELNNLDLKYNKPDNILMENKRELRKNMLLLNLSIICFVFLVGLTLYKLKS